MRKKEYDSIIDGVRVPFSAHGDASDENLNKGRRVRIVREFMSSHIKDIEKLHTLDIGPPNAFGRALGFKVNTQGDLNWGVCPILPVGEMRLGRFDVILFSEIIEHLMNPLTALEDCHALLKSGGYMVVSTPLMMWHSGISYQSPHHVVEYRKDRFQKMLEFAGFEVVKYKKINIWDKKFALYGVRPLLRVLFHRSQLWLVRKP